MLKKTLLFLLILVLGVVIVMFYNTFRFDSLQLEEVPEPSVHEFDEDAAVTRFAESLRFETVSVEPEVVAEDEFEEFHEFLEASFPLIFEELEIEWVNNYSLLIKWEGTDEDLNPVLLMAHQDVVPIESPDEWTHPPFEGVVDDGVVWGRGAVDNKNGVMGILEAVTTLMEAGHQPERTIKLAFGHDEEVGGMYGARKIADKLEERGTEFEFVLDEGGYVTEGELPVDRPVAVVGTSEKGLLSLELIVSGRGGHSSMPPRETPIGILSAAIHKLENSPFPASISGPARDLFRYAGPEMSFGEQLILSNLWLTEPLVTRMFADSPATNAMMRTTAAPTMMKGSDKDNILPSEAKIVVNFRIMPGESVESVKEYVQETIDDDRIELRNHRGYAFEPSPVSDADTEQFDLLHQTIRQIYPDIYVSPFLMVAATDSRHFTELSDHVYRFLPAHLNEEESEGFHAVDEQLRTEVYLKMIRFYQQLLLNAS